jgi:phospholipid/cholesterol/gamma-HCH transport system substrate-binding protein
VSPTVELDEVFRAFDPGTRNLFSTWLDQQGVAVGSHGRELNDALASLEPFADDVEDVLEVLDEQRGATRRLVRDTGEVFAALTERRGQLRQLISSSNRVFATTAQRDRELAEAFTALPRFLDETRLTTRRITGFAQETDPLITQLRPAARALSPTLRDLGALAPDLRGFLTQLGPLTRVSRRGLPATERFLDETEPLLGRLDPFLADLNPILEYLGLYRREIAAFFANDAAATQAGSPQAGGLLHYLRVTNPLNAEVLAAYPHRLVTNKSNPYVEPGGYAKLPTGLEVFGSYLCTDNPLPTLSPDIPEDLRRIVQEFVYTADPGGPPCEEQAPLGPLVGQLGPLVDQLGGYPQLLPDP